MDECWLDVTGSLRIFGSARKIAEQIRLAVREELGLTVSIGVSFNKVFAKLGSDLKKPDAVTEITPETFRTQVWPLPVNELIGISGATQKALAKLCIRTIGDLAASDPECLCYKIGKVGRELWEAANGLEHSPVTRSDFVFPIKSIGHGTTLPEDLTENEQVWPVFLELAQDVAYRLRQNKLKAGAIAIQIRNENLQWKEWETRLATPTDHALSLAQAAQQLFEASYVWSTGIHSMALRAIRLQETDRIEQLSFFDEETAEPEQSPLDRTVDALRTRFGNGIIRNAVLYNQAPLRSLEEDNSIPTGSSRMKAKSNRDPDVQ
jgi:DNA polymerase-4